MHSKLHVVRQTCFNWPIFTKLFIQWSVLQCIDYCIYFDMSVFAMYKIKRSKIIFFYRFRIGIEKNRLLTQVECSPLFRHFWTSNIIFIFSSLMVFYADRIKHCHYKLTRQHRKTIKFNKGCMPFWYVFVLSAHYITALLEKNNCMF